MALEVRPTLQNMIVFQVVVVGLLGGVAFLSLKNPTKYYYSPVYDDHHAEYGGKPMACRDCHLEPFQAVPNAGCANSGCHPRYVPEYRGFRDATIYDAKWTSIAPEELRKAREENASLLYHHAPNIAALNCRDCHDSHTPPPDGKPIHYDHDGHSYGDIQCIGCHQPAQAPPIVAHEALLKGDSSVDCFACHQSGESWTKSVEWAGRPADSSYEDGLRLIADRSVSYRSIAAAGPISSQPEQAPEAVPSATPEPTPEATPPLFITPTPAPTPEAESIGEVPPFATEPGPAVAEPEPVSAPEPAATPQTFAAATPVPVDDEAPFTLDPAPSQPAALPEASPVPTPVPTPEPTPAPAYVWDTFWQQYDPAVGLDALDGKPAIVYFSHPGVPASRRFEIFAAEMQSVMAEIDGRMAPIVVDMSRHKEVADRYGVVAAPTLARLNENSTLRDKHLFGGYPTETEILEYLRRP